MSFKTISNDVLKSSKVWFVVTSFKEACKASNLFIIVLEFWLSLSEITVFKPAIMLTDASIFSAKLSIL